MFVGLSGSKVVLYQLDTEGRKVHPLQEAKVEGALNILPIDDTLFGVLTLEIPNTISLYRFDFATYRLVFVRQENAEYWSYPIQNGWTVQFTVKGCTIVDYRGTETKVMGRIPPTPYWYKWTEVFPVQGTDDLITIGDGSFQELYSLANPSQPQLLHTIRCETTRIAWMNGSLRFQRSTRTRSDHPYDWYPYELVRLEGSAHTYVALQVKIPETQSRRVRRFGTDYKPLILSTVNDKFQDRLSTAYLGSSTDEKLVLFGDALKMYLWQLVPKKIGGIDVMVEAKLILSFDLKDKRNISTNYSCVRISSSKLLIAIHCDRVYTNYVLDFDRQEILELTNSENLHMRHSFVPKLSMVEAVRLYKSHLIDAGLPRDLALLVCQYMVG